MGGIPLPKLTGLAFLRGGEMGGLFDPKGPLPLNPGSTRGEPDMLRPGMASAGGLLLKAADLPQTSRGGVDSSETF